MSDDDVVKEEEGADMGVVVLMLGLYLIVLAFFILMNAISQDSPERHEMVVESVREGFSYKDPGTGSGPDNTDVEAIPLYESTTKSIQGVVQSHLPLDNYDVEVTPTHVQAVLNSRSFFRREEETLIPDMILFFQDMARTLIQGKPGIQINTHVLVVADDDEVGTRSDIKAFELAGRRSALFTRALIDEGVSPAEISAAAIVGVPKITLRFDIHVLDGNVPGNDAPRLEHLLQNNTHTLTNDEVSP